MPYGYSGGGGGDAVPVGTVLDFAGVDIPGGWVECDGSTLEQADYPALYAVIGSNFNRGDEGGYQFRLPDCKGRVPVGKGQDDDDRIWGLGENGGESDHILTESEMPQHAHEQPAHAHDGGLGTVTTGNIAQGEGGEVSVVTAVESASTGEAGSDQTSQSGGGEAHPNVQRYIVFAKIIKAA
ncbi:MAG: tail fiber protein [Planctomycetes bacterium]|nr:tail fiber protein [Planctomycetota bacterium]